MNEIQCRQIKKQLSQLQVEAKKMHLALREIMNMGVPVVKEEHRIAREACHQYQKYMRSHCD